MAAATAGPALSAAEQTIQAHFLSLGLACCIEECTTALVGEAFLATTHSGIDPALLQKRSAAFVFLMSHCVKRHATGNLLNDMSS
jgi:hypothetical protein